MKGLQSYKLKRLLIIIGITAAVYLVLKYLLPLVIPFLFAYWLAKLLAPMALHLEKHLHLKRTIGTGILLFLLAAAAAGFCYLFAESMFTQLKELSANSERYLQEADRWLQERLCVIEETFGMLDGSLLRFVQSTWEQTWESLRADLLPRLFMNQAYPMVILFSELGALLLVMVTATILFVQEGDGMAKRLHENTFGVETLKLMRRLDCVAGAYIRTQLIIILCVLAMCVCVLMLLRQPYSIVIGSMIALVDALPLFGSGSVLIPWCIVSLLTGSYVRAAALFTLYLACYFTREFLETRMMGKEIGISQLATLAAMYVGLKLFGLAGLILGPIGLIMWKEVDKFFSIS